MDYNARYKATPIVMPDGCLVAGCCTVKDPSKQWIGRSTYYPAVNE
jgi:hypothetical protein